MSVQLDNLEVNPIVDGYENSRPNYIRTVGNFSTSHKHYDVGFNKKKIQIIDVTDAKAEPAGIFQTSFSVGNLKRSEKELELMGYAKDYYESINAPSLADHALAAINDSMDEQKDELVALHIHSKAKELAAIAFDAATFTSTVKSIYNAMQASLSTSMAKVDLLIHQDIYDSMVNTNDPVMGISYWDDFVNKSSSYVASRVISAKINAGFFMVCGQFVHEAIGVDSRHETPVKKGTGIFSFNMRRHYFLLDDIAITADDAFIFQPMTGTILLKANENFKTISGVHNDKKAAKKKSEPIETVFSNTEPFGA